MIQETACCWKDWLHSLEQKDLHHVTVTEASERLGLAPRAGYLTRLCRKGKIPEAYLSSGVWLIPVPWIISEGKRKGFLTKDTPTLPFPLSDEGRGPVVAPSRGRDRTNMDLLLLEMEEIVERFEYLAKKDAQEILT